MVESANSDGSPGESEDSRLTPTSASGVASMPTMNPNDLVDLDPPGPERAPDPPSSGDLVDLDVPSAPPRPVTPAAPATTSRVPTNPPPSDVGLVDLDPPITVSVVESEGVAVTIRGPDGPIATFPSQRLKRSAKIWSQVVSNRERWKNLAGGSVDLIGKSREVFLSVGITEEHLAAIAAARLVEVSVPFQREDEGWEALIFPWEAMLSAATKPNRGDASLWVVRHLDRVVNESRPFAGKTLFYTQSVPRALREWNFDSERERVVSNLPSFTVDLAIDLSREELAAKVQKVCPGLIHVAGFDTWQGAALLNLPYSPQRRDGLLLTTRTGDPEEINGDALSAFLNGVPLRPWLVSLNVYNSGGRLAPLAVVGGSWAAVGFQDIFDDDLAEQFFARFYAALDSADDILRAFLSAQAVVREESNRMIGSGLVLWRECLLQPTDKAAIPDQAVVSQQAGPPPGQPPTAAPFGQLPGHPPAGLPLAPAGPWPFGPPEVKPWDKLNYAMLHNKSEIFEKFVLRRKSGHIAPIYQVTVRVELYLAAPSACSWEKTFDVAQSDEPLLHSEIHLPLISDLQRSLRYSLLTNLKIRIEYRQRCYYQETFSVELLAIDEWRDDDMSRVWLPSFVLPGDPTVPKIIDDAQRYLTTLVDEYDTGFEGYQRINRTVEVLPGKAPQPGPSPMEVVDFQVRAIWSTLWLDNALRYINEPPTYTLRSQRIRPPSTVIAERRGTCIDLTLMLAACLEYIDVYPVIFLLRGHAMPGFWRDPAERRRFSLGLSPSDTDPMANAPPSVGGTAARGRRAPWFFDQSRFPDIRKLIDSGALVPIETTDLAHNSGFKRAREHAYERILAGRFESMMDVRLAREHGVTPLPLTKEKV
jgi:hypothetical protein